MANSPRLLQMAGIVSDGPADGAAASLDAQDHVIQAGKQPVDALR